MVSTYQLFMHDNANAVYGEFLDAVTQKIQHCFRSIYVGYQIVGLSIKIKTEK